MGGLKKLSNSNLAYFPSPLWGWSDGVVVTYPSFGLPTKTGVMPQDLRSFTGVPLARRNPYSDLTDGELLQFIRSSEDDVERKSSVLLCPTLVASPPARNAQQCNAANIVPNNPSLGLVQGVDYDLADSGYDFDLSSWQDNGWGEMQLRYCPLRITDGSITAVKLIAFVYPALNQIFQMPIPWVSETLDRATLRIVPQGNLGILPLFAMQINYMGMTSTVPNGIWVYYTAGLTKFDYGSRFSFIKRLILCDAAINVLGSLQGSINLGLDTTTILIDGVQQTIRYRAGGVYSDLIKQFSTQRDNLLQTLSYCVGGGNFIVF